MQVPLAIEVRGDTLLRNVRLWMKNFLIKNFKKQKDMNEVL